MAGNDLLTQALREQQLLTAVQLHELDRLAADFPEPNALGQELVHRGWLTAYQLEQLLQGKGAALTMGPYLLLEPLGAGGMGHVFKASHRLMNRQVAIKLMQPWFGRPQVCCSVSPPNGRFWRT